jgi:hypothetical protein
VSAGDAGRSERRLIENEQLVRRVNRRIEDRLVTMREQDGDEDTDAPIAFFCECSSLECVARFEAAPSQWRRIHRRDDQFVVLEGHEAAEVEDVVDRFGGACLIVRKRALPA